MSESAAASSNNNAAAGPSSGSANNGVPSITGDARKDTALAAYKKALKQHEDLSEGLKKSEYLPASVIAPLERLELLSGWSCLLTPARLVHSAIRPEGSGEGL